MKKTFVPLLIVGVLLIPFGAFVIFSLESTNDDSEIKTLLDAFWWSAVTITTVGYGDLVPVTDSGRVFTIFYMFSGIGIAGIFLSVLTNRVYKKRVERSVEHGVTEPEKTIIKKIEELEKQQKQNTEILEKLLKKLEERN